ncbi:cytoplasmic 60S subunit biogenesis factor ZNF622 [Syngnathoides biaculeatus]|uniref:cytoplasmic 60S subunit biogenesis factor ZNF622 n=1 Tax=Syngnathoides biaculeatus TaxID=300417 RepID=UPI002ADDA0DB|nr:cytoplasmic 60S subunit biogenesis factor ZNF622 [Syngnathoides biaculeatus]
MSSYTCISCRVAFSDGEVQRAHYKSDWHRYNLKRKVADMPPVSAANFQERVLLQRSAAECHPSNVGEVCAVCNKKFCSANAFRNHLQSQRHQQAERRALQAARQQVDKLNQKNLEKGLGSEDKEDRDARNKALQQAFKEQCRTSQKEAPVRSKEKKAEKPPRLVWLEEQAKRRERDEGAAAEDEWEDMDEDEDDEEDMEEDDEDEPTEEKDGDPAASSNPDQPAITPLPGSIPVTDCLFCSHHSKSLLRNVAHMTHVHSFFIPDLQYLVDLRGLVRYLGEKVGAGNVCLWCNEKGRSFYSTEAVQSHMTDKSHCKLFTDGDAALEFADFYDFRSSYPDRGDDDMDDEELPDDKNFEYDDETMELTLPSGARIGHRSLMRYYKQRFGNERTLTLSHNRNAVGRVLRQYKALGWAGDAGLGSVRCVRDMQYVQMMKSKWMLKMGMSHNATKQKHFRPQVIF